MNKLDSEMISVATMLFVNGISQIATRVPEVVFDSSDKQMNQISRNIIVNHLTAAALPTLSVLDTYVELLSKEQFINIHPDDLLITIILKCQHIMYGSKAKNDNYDLMIACVAQYSQILSYVIQQDYMPNLDSLYARSQTKTPYFHSIRRTDPVSNAHINVPLFRCITIPIHIQFFQGLFEITSSMINNDSSIGLDHSKKIVNSLYRVLYPRETFKKPVSIGISKLIVDLIINNIELPPKTETIKYVDHTIDLIYAFGENFTENKESLDENLMNKFLDIKSRKKLKADTTKHLLTELDKLATKRN